MVMLCRICTADQCFDLAEKLRASRVGLSVGGVQQINLMKEVKR